jgi:hypothetical protein
MLDLKFKSIVAVQWVSIQSRAPMLPSAESHQSHDLDASVIRERYYHASALSSARMLREMIQDT